MIDSLSRAVDSVVVERRYQDEKWGSQRDLPPYLWQAILKEEVAEVNTEVAVLAFKGNNLDALRAELVQVAAVAVAWIEAIDSGLVNG